MYRYTPVEGMEFDLTRLDASSGEIQLSVGRLKIRGVTVK